MRRGARLLFIATLVAQGSALLRYTIMARFLGPEQLGLAAAIILFGQFFDSVTDSGGDRFLIQDRDGDDRRVQGLVQLMLGVRGAVVAFALIACAEPVAALYHAPALAPGLMLLALSPLIFGLVHTDLARQQRRSDFRAEALALLVAETTATVVTAAAAYLTRDFTAVVWGLIARSSLTVVVSFLRAERPFRFVYARDHAGRLAAFAAPLMINGLVLFLGQQGDRILVGGQLGITELGRYSVVTLLAYYPTATLLKFVGVVHLPRIAAAREDRHDREHAIGVLAGQTLLLGVAMVAGFLVTAPVAIHLLFGQAYAQSLLVVALVGVLQVLRFLRLWPTTSALALGYSRQVMIANVLRLATMPLALLGGALLHNVSGVVAGFVVGEVLALSVGLVMLNRSRRVGLLDGFGRVAAFLAACALVVVWAVVMQHPALLPAGAAAAATVAFAAYLYVTERVTLQGLLAPAAVRVRASLPHRPPEAAE